MKTEQIMELVDEYGSAAMESAHECAGPDTDVYRNDVKKTLKAAIEALVQERDALSKLADKWNLECDELREDNKRLAAEVKTLRDGLRVYQTQLEKDTNESDLHALMRQGVEIAELKAELAGIIEKNREPIEQCNAYIARIEAENKTLRDALEEIVGTTDGVDCNEKARSAIKWSDYEPD